MSEARKYRKFTPAQKLELVLASLRGERSVAEICREHAISETLLRRWREQLLEAGVERFAGKEERSVHAVVLAGQLLIDLEDRDSVTLDPHQGFTVPKGVVHRTRAPRRTSILMIEAAGVVPTGD